MAGLELSLIDRLEFSVSTRSGVFFHVVPDAPPSPAGSRSRDPERPLPARERREHHVPSPRRGEKVAQAG